MKLARPDVFHPRIVLAGCRQHPDDAGLVSALRTRGLHARRLEWDDPETVGADLVILRQTADADRRDEFLAWTRRVKNLLNPPAMVAWNLDARYLDDIEKAGVPTLPGAPAQSVLIFFGGQPSHAWPVEPEFETWELGHAAMAAAAGRADIRTSELLYARVDVSDARVTALDVVAPSLGWGQLDAGARELAQRAFALAVESACERLGLGPFSQPFSH
ncbi:MAG: hypothetical protein VYA67_04345 [Actinomycetota bacterium]|uniref:Glutathione synthase/ribosomal protein S6 modification protein n=1 Tax=Mycobacterium lentiflavum TaxID=141349 RepID=A0ABY3V4A0_MYCLN|nr:hypothetical protein [Mycobacterium lentiflavum]MEE3063180.1 hypothetical protein [Actinomycetota bacterium]ULP44458.1 hypothetical protein MJO58_11315 [Mycobacterium lentiflavum]